MSTFRTDGVGPVYSDEADHVHELATCEPCIHQGRSVVATESAEAALALALADDAAHADALWDRQREQAEAAPQSGLRCLPGCVCEQASKAVH